MEYGLVILCDAVGEVSAEEGYAGGIVSAAVDGIRCAEAVLSGEY